jgi:hypothetical protein
MVAMSILTAINLVMINCQQTDWVHFFDFSLTQQDIGLTLSDTTTWDVTIVVLPLGYVLQVVDDGKCW